MRLILNYILGSLFVVSSLVSSNLFAQKTTPSEDSVVKTKSDTLAQRLSLPPKYKISAPLRASLLSAALPGAGQYYNKKAWLFKTSIIYGAGATLGYLILQNHDNYRIYRENYLHMVDENPATKPLPSFENRSADQVQRQRDSYRRDRDYYIILSCILYVLQIGEATTTAHLNNFDIDDDISLHLKPHTEVIGFAGQRINGLSLVMTF